MTRGFNAKFRVFEGAYPVTLDFGFTCWRAAFDIPPHDWLRGAAIARERGAHSPSNKPRSTSDGCGDSSRQYVSKSLVTLE